MGWIEVARYGEESRYIAPSATCRDVGYDNDFPLWPAASHRGPNSISPTSPIACSLKKMTATS